MMERNKLSCQNINLDHPGLSSAFLKPHFALIRSLGSIRSGGRDHIVGWGSMAQQFNEAAFHTGHPPVPYKISQDGLEAESATSPPRRSQMSLRPSQGLDWYISVDVLIDAVTAVAPAWKVSSRRYHGSESHWASRISAHLKGSFEELAVIVGERGLVECKGLDFIIFVNLANKVQVLGQEIVDRREENIRRGEWEHQERE